MIMTCLIILLVLVSGYGAWRTRKNEKIYHQTSQNIVQLRNQLEKELRIK